MVATEIKTVRFDISVETRSSVLCETQYGFDFAKGYRADAELGTVLKKEGVETLDELLKKERS